MADWQISVDSDFQVFPAESNEIWIKGTIVCTDLNDINFALVVGNTSIGENAVGISSDQASDDGSIALNCDDDWETSNYHLTAGTNSSFIIHILSDDTNGIFEVTWSDGTTEIPFRGNVYGGETFNAIQIDSYTQSAFFSDVIVSNAALSFAITQSTQILNVDTARQTVNNSPYLINFDFQNNPGDVYLSADDGDFPATKEIWIKGTLVYNGFNSSGRTELGCTVYSNDRSTDYSIYFTETSGDKPISIDFVVDGNFIDKEHPLQLGDTLSFVVHLLSDTTNGVFEIYWSDGSKSIGVNGGNVSDGYDFDDIYLFSYGTETFLSNVTIANYPLYLDNQSQNVDLYVDTCRNVSVWYSGYCPVTLSIDTRRDVSVWYESFRNVDYAFPQHYPDNLKEFWVKVTYEKTSSWSEYDGFRCEFDNHDQWWTAANDDDYNYRPLELICSESDTNPIKARCNGVGNMTTHYLNVNEPISFIVHVKSSANSGIFDITWTDGTRDILFSGNVHYGYYFDEFYFSTGEDSGIFRNIVVSNAPLTFNAAELGTLPITLSVDTRRDVSVWRYENYGTADLLSTSGTTVTNLTKNQAVYQTAFYQSNRAKCFDIPATKEIWIKFDVYFDGTNRWRAYNGGSNGLTGITAQSDGGLSFFANEKNVSPNGVNIAGVCIANQLQTVLLHMVSNSSAGVVEAWVDDTFIYRAVGNVNNGNDFADIYLQSDGAGTFFSNVIISNVAVDINEHTKYPLAFNVDLLRNVSETFAQQFYVDTLRNVVLRLPNSHLKVDLTFNNSPTDDNIVFNAWKTYGNPYVSTTHAVSGNALQLAEDPFIYLENFEIGGQDFCIEGVVYVSTQKYGGTVFDLRQNDDDESASYSVLSLKSTSEQSGVHLFVQSSYQMSAYIKFEDSESAADKTIHFKIIYQYATGLIIPYINGRLIESTGGNLGFKPKIPRHNNYTLTIGAFGFTNRFAGALDNFRLYDGIVDPSSDTPIPSFDTCRNVIYSAIIDEDTCRNVIRTVDQNLDTVRTLAHNLILSPVYNFGDLPDTSNDRRAGLQFFEIQIGEQQLTDSVNFVSVNPVDILEQVKGQYLDYKFNMRVEKIVQRGILRTCNCCSDIDELLYKQLDYVIPEEKRWTEYARPPIGLIEPREEDKILRYAPASEHINAIANAIGKTPVLQFADFVSNVDITSGGTTYNDLIKAIFGWSARVPQMMINCYLRDDKLFVVQRGHESNIVDLSNYQSDVVSVSKDIVRTYWGSHIWSETEVTERPAGYSVDFITKAAPTEKVDANGKKTTYTPSSSGKVLVTQTEENVNGQTIIKTFDYDDDDFLILSTEQGSNYKIQTSYEYKTFGKNQKVLVRETTTVSEKNSSGVWEVTDQRTTSHDCLYEGGGQVYISSNVTDLADVDHTGNVVGNKNGNDRISPYQIYIWEDGERKALEGIIKTPIYDKVHRTIYGVTLFDSSFPVHGDDKLIEITDAIKWLNRKTQEVINLNVYDFPHVIDFNDRIVFGGNTYYLKSNTALKNDNIVNKQSISAVRWY